MTKRKLHQRLALAIAGALAAFGIACRISKGFAALALAGLSVPAMALLHRLTAPVPFPIVELLVVALAACLALGLLFAVVRAVASRKPAPATRWLASLAWTALVLGGALLLLWGPAREASPADLPPVPKADQLEWLCGQLVDALNGSELRFSPADEILRLAPQVAGLPDHTVKAARYPEWMRAARVSGLFIPLTGEALADASAPAPLIPFTAVHELMHLTGIADEGAANIAAWERCLSAGGEFADSARLWALRYAMGLLNRTDGTAGTRVREKMEGALERTFQICGGEAAADARITPGPSLLSLNRGDYAALVGYLIEREL